MIQGISSLVKGPSKIDGPRTWVLHVLGGAGGGAAAVSLVWLSATPLRTFLPPGVSKIIALGLIGLFIASDLNVIDLPRPLRQVPKSWYARFGVMRSYVLYGAALGMGLATFVPYAVVYALYAMALTTSFGTALEIGAVFGASRAAMTAVGLTGRGATDRLAAKLGALYLRLPVGSAILSTIIGVTVASGLHP